MVHAGTRGKVCLCLMGTTTEDPRLDNNSSPLLFCVNLPASHRSFCLIIGESRGRLNMSLGAQHTSISRPLSGVYVSLCIYFFCWEREGEVERKSRILYVCHSPVAPRLLPRKAACLVSGPRTPSLILIFVWGRCAHCCFESASS